jgi:hypothetical protein
VKWTGRKWFTVHGWPGDKFSLEDGRNGGQFMYPFAVTVAQFEELQEREVIVRELRRAYAGDFARAQFDMGTLRRLHAAVKGDSREEFRLVRTGRNDQESADHVQVFLKGSLAAVEQHLLEVAPFEKGSGERWAIQRVRVVELVEEAVEVTPESVREAREKDRADR